LVELKKKRKELPGDQADESEIRKILKEEGALGCPSR
jgi:hypothetical protein